MACEQKVLEYEGFGWKGKWERKDGVLVGAGGCEVEDGGVCEARMSIHISVGFNNLYPR